MRRNNSTAANLLSGWLLGTSVGIPVGLAIVLILKIAGLF